VNLRPQDHSRLHTGITSGNILSLPLFSLIMGGRPRVVTVLNSSYAMKFH
jgi:hypothetical protein